MPTTYCISDNRLKYYTIESTVGALPYILYSIVATIVLNSQKQLASTTVDPNRRKQLHQDVLKNVNCRTYLFVQLGI